MTNPKKIVHVSEWDFYETVLRIQLQCGSLLDRLAELAWDELYDAMQDTHLEQFWELRALAGRRYPAKVELDGSTVRVIIYDAEEEEDGQ